MSKLMKTCWSWLFVTLLAFTGASALADTTLLVNDDWAALADGTAVEGGVIGTTAFGTIQKAVNAADVSAGAVTISVKAGTYAETVTLSGKSNLIYEDGTKIGRLHFIADGAVTMNGSFTFGNDSVKSQDICDMQFTGFMFTNESIPIYIMNSGTASRNIVIKDNTATFATPTQSYGVFYVNSATVDGLTVTGNTVTGNTYYSASFGAQGGTINNVIVAGNTFDSFIGVFGQVLADGVTIGGTEAGSGNTFTGTASGDENIWFKDNKGDNVGKITIAGNTFSAAYPYVIGFNTKYGKKTDITIGEGNTYGGATITAWADVADDKFLVSADAAKGEAQYYNEKLYLGDETAFKSAKAAYDAAGENGTIVLMGGATPQEIAKKDSILWDNGDGTYDVVRKSAVFLARDGKFIGSYDDIAAGVVAFNAATELGEYVLSITNGIYELPLNQIVIRQYDTPGKNLTIRPWGDGTYPVTLVPGGDLTANKNNDMFAVSGQDSYHTPSSVTFTNLYFDMSGKQMTTADNTRVFAVSCGSGDDARYAHDICLTGCKFKGFGGKIASALGSNHSNSNPRDLRIENCVGENLNCWFNGYGHEGLVIKNCVSTNFLCIGNFMSSDPNVTIDNVDGTFFYPVTKIGETDPDGKGSESGVIYSNGGVYTIRNCEIKTLGTGSDATANGIVFTKKNTSTVTVTDSTFDRSSSATIYDVKNGGTATVNGSNANGNHMVTTQSVGATYNFPAAVAMIGETGYATLWSAITAAKDMTGTVENPTVVQLMPGVIQTGSIYQDTFDLSNVVIQGAADGTSTIKDCQISFQGGYDKLWKNVTFKNIVWDASYVVFSVFKSEDLAFIGNTFTNQTRDGSLGGVHFTTECKNLVYANNVFAGGTAGSIAAINSNGAGLTGNITITNNVFRNSNWRSLQLMFKSNDGVNDTITLQDNWFVGNAGTVQIRGSGATSSDTVVANINYNVFDETDDSLYLYSTDQSKTTYVLDHNYFSKNPDAMPNAFYFSFGEPTADTIYNAGVYPYYNAYHKDELTAGTMTVRESLYNLVQPGAVRVTADGKAPVYADLAAAVAAAESGDRVKMLVDSDANVVLKTGVTLDTNQKSYTGTPTAEDGSIIKNNGDGTYTAVEAVASIGKTMFGTLAEAVAAVKNGETIKVLKSGNVVTEYAKQIGEEGYSEAAGANRLVFGVEGAFTLNLNGKELCGRINFTKGSMTVAKGTLRASSQALNIYGSKTYTEEPHTTITLKNNATVKAAYGIAIFGGDPSNTMWPLGFGETVNIYGKVYAPSPVFVSGNVGMDTYVDNLGVVQEIEDLKIAKGKSISQMMLEHGPVINVYEGAELGSSPEAGSTDDSPQGISMQGCTTVNVFGGRISGAEAIGVKGGCLNVTGGTLLGTGPKCDPIAAINSGTESSGGAISVSTFYNANYPIVVNVTGGMIKSANNAALVVAHSYSGKTPTPVVQGISLTVAGGTFIGGADEEAIAVEESVATDAAGKWPANFMWPEMNGTAETGYPLCSSKILPRYIAAGYVEKDNQNGTWTVTAGSPEIKVVDNDFTAKYEKDDTVTDAEAQTAANEVKDEIKETLKDPSVSDVIGTGVNESTKEGDKLRTDVVDALKDAAPADQKDQITVDSTTTSFVEIKLDDIKVSVTSTQEEGQPKVIEKTLTAITYEVKPIVTTITKSGDVETTVKAVIPAGAVLAKPITFRLWLDETFVSDAVEVTHKSSLTADPIDVKTYLVQTEEGKRYIDLTWNQFSYAILKSTSTGEKACLVDGTLYDTVADALAASIPTDATITLLKDCGETGLALGNDRTLALNGHAFTGSLAMDAGKEMVKTKADTIYVAPEAVKVPTSGTASLPIRGFTFPGDVTTDEAKKAYLAADDTNGRPRWQNYILGTSVKLVPEIVGAAEGFSTVVIKAATGWTMTTPAKADVAVKFNLVKKDAGDGAFAQYGSTSDTPHFQVNVNDIGPKTFWKIQTMFESTEAE